MTKNSLVIEINGKLVKVVKRTVSGYAGSSITYTEYHDLTEQEIADYYEVRSHSDKSK